MATQICVALSGLRSVAAPPTSEVELDIDGPSNFQLSFGTFVGQGSAGSQTLTTRSMNSVNGYLLIGHKSGYITPFLIGSYGFSEQSTDSSRVSGTNISGSGLSAGAGLRLNLGSLFLSGAYLPIGAFTLSRKTVDGQKVSYGDPHDVLIFIGYSFESLSAFVVHRSTGFSKTSIGTTTIANGDDKILATSVGGGIEWSF
ncbi:MAG: hypothetical protein K2X47_18210 [Bdellovibrionales bacterium]|nr:hypothetical protein [Bdellovibrionales bacterium]